MDITITMVQDEIMDAIKDFMIKHDVVTVGKEIDINLVAGRGPAGHSAVIAIKGNIPSGIVIPAKPVHRAATPLVDEEEMRVSGNPIPNLFAADPPADSKAAMRIKNIAGKPDVAAAVQNEVDALFATENSMTEDRKDEVTEAEDVLFGAE
jgi:hypothetical protein